MKVYLFIFLYVAFVGFISRTRIYQLGIDNQFGSRIMPSGVFFTMALPVMFIGLRSYVADTSVYIITFNNFHVSLSEIISNISQSRGVGWEIYEWLIKNFVTTDVFIFLLITAAFQGIVVGRLYYHYSNDCAYSILLYFISCSFTYMLNGMRQFMAVTVVLLFFDDFVKGNRIRFLLAILVASSIHMSALIWLPAMIVVRGKPFGLKIMLCFIGILIIIVYLNYFTVLFDSMLEDTVYDGYINQFNEDDGANWVHTIISMVPVVIAYRGKSTFLQEDDMSLNIMINLSVLAFLMSLLSNFTSGILIGRLPVYFSLTNYALMPILFCKVFKEPTQNKIRTACTLGYSAFGLYYLYATGLPYYSSVLSFLN